MEEKTLKRALLTIKDVTHLLNISRRTVYYWIKKGFLHPIRIGTVFRFHPEDIEAVTQRQHPAAIPPKKRILAIDDDFLVRESLKTLLEKIGFEASVVGSGQEALELISRESFDLILTDVRMPVMDGIETLKAIRQLRKRLGKLPLPEIVLTAYDDQEVRKEIKRLGVKEFILKPFDMDQFLGTLRKVLSLPEEKSLKAIP